MSRNSNTSQFEFADDVRRDVCTACMLDPAMALDLPSPEKFIAAIEVFQDNSFRSTENHFYEMTGRIGFGTTTDPDTKGRFEEAQKDFLKLTEKSMREVFEVATLKATLLDDTNTESQADMYEELLKDTVILVVGADGISNHEREQRYHDAAWRFEFPLMKEIENTIELYRYARLRESVKLISNPQGAHRSSPRRALLKIVPTKPHGNGPKSG